MLIAHPFDIALMARSQRVRLKLRQTDVARAAGVGREWIVDLEHGKPTLEIGRVMKTLDVLGFDFSLRWREDAPEWTKPLTEATIAKETRRALPRLRPKTPRPLPRAPRSWRDLMV